MAVADGFGPYIGQIDRRLKELEDERDKDAQDIAVLSDRVREMTKAFEALRTALYVAAGTVVALAFGIVLLGQHP